MSGTGYVDLRGEHLRSVLAGYYGNITFADFQIGRILLALDALPNTYVIFTSDHGEQLGDHYLYHKSRPYEGASHIPFLIAGPGIEPLQIRHEPIGWHDIMPTLLDLADLPLPDGMDGRSLRPLVRGIVGSEADTAPWRTHLHCENSMEGAGGRMYPRLPGQRTVGNLVYEPSWHSVTDGKWKFIWWDHSGQEQLFHVAEDPDEQNDLADDLEHAPMLKTWRSRLATDLRGRPEGFSPDGISLVPGRPHSRLSAAAQQLVDDRIRDGHSIGYYRAPAG